MRKKTNPDRTVWLDRCVIQHPFLALCLSEDAFLAALKHCRIDKPWPEWITTDASATCHTLTNDERTVCIVCMDNDPEWSLSCIVALLAHEARHVWQEALELYPGMKDEEEMSATGIQLITDRLVADWLRQTKRSNKL